MAISKLQFGISVAVSAALSLLLTFILLSVLLIVIFKKNAGDFPAVARVFTGGAVFISIYLILMRKYIKRKIILSGDFPGEWESILKSDVFYYNNLDEQERERYKREVKIFIGEKKITGIGTSVDDRCRLLVASSAIIPVFGHRDWEYQGVDEILVYPTGFDDNFRFNSRSDQIGSAGTDSFAVIITKTDLYLGFQQNRRFEHVGIHEFAHKIDGQDGEMDGIPELLMDEKTKIEWLNIMNIETGRIRRGRSDLDSYALEDRSEFFAVVSEYFFKTPDKLKLRHPELYDILKKIFKQDTALMYGKVRSKPST